MGKVGIVDTVGIGSKKSCFLKVVLHQFGNLL